MQEEHKPNDHEERLIRRQFQKGFTDGVGKKALDIHQKSEYTRLSKTNEGLCYLCWKKDYVIPTVVDVCWRCAHKKGHEPLLAIVSKKMFGYCFAHGGYSTMEYENNIAQVNVRICEKCHSRVKQTYRKVKFDPQVRVDPFWKYVRRKLGQDWRILMQNPQSLRI